MSSASRLVVLLILLTPRSAAADLRICADPENLPYSNVRHEGFENHLAVAIAHDLHRRPQFVWAVQRGEYLKKTIGAGACDLILGVPAAVTEVQATHPYYRSSYSFVSRRDKGWNIRSFDDDALRRARIGVHIIGHDDAAVPPAQALLDRGLTRNIVWYRLFPDYSRPNPPAALIEGVEKGDIDVAVAWGPMAGYFAQHSPVSLNVVSVSPQYERGVPLAFDISMGVRRGDTALLRELNSWIDQHHAEIRRLLHAYGIPQVER